MRSPGFQGVALGALWGLQGRGWGGLARVWQQGILGKGCAEDGPSVLAGVHVPMHLPTQSSPVHPLS